MQTIPVEKHKEVQLINKNSLNHHELEPYTIEKNKVAMYKLDFFYGRSLLWQSTVLPDKRSELKNINTTLEH